MTALTNTVWVEPCEKKIWISPWNFGTPSPQKSQTVSRFPAKSPDYQKNYLFLLKQPFLELTLPPITWMKSDTTLYEDKVFCPRIQFPRAPARTQNQPFGHCAVHGELSSRSTVCDKTSVVVRIFSETFNSVTYMINCSTSTFSPC